MNLCSSRVGLAISVMIELYRDPTARTTVAKLCKVLDVSHSYVENLLATLKNAKIVIGFKGPHGGYEALIPANKLSLADIVNALGHEYSPVGHSAKIESVLSIYAKQLTLDKILACM